MPTFVAGSGVGDNYGNFLLPVIDVDWFKRALMGALFELTKPDNWIEMGDIGVSFAVEEAAKMIDGYKFMNFNPFPVGIVVPFAGSSEPVVPLGYLLCDGSVYANADYPELASVLGDVWIDDEEHFFLPDLRGFTVIGAGEGVGWTPTVLGESGGTETVILDSTQIPSHIHTIPTTTTTLAFEPGEMVVATPVPFIDSYTGSTGNDMAHTNMQPWMSLNYIIYAGRV